MTVPELYLVGAPKAGTTSVADWLGSHPDVFWSTPKEPFHWAADYPRVRAHYGFTDRADYERLFSSRGAAAARVRAEGSTTYLYSRVAVPSIIEQVPGARFIVCLRDPVELVVSYHRTQVVALNEDELDFPTAWRRHLRGQLPRTAPLDHKLVDYSLVGRLGSALASLLSHVPRERVHLVWFDDLVHRPGAVWDDLADFTGVERSPRPSFAARNRSQKMFRYERLRRLTHRPPRALDLPMRQLRQWSRTTPAPGVKAIKRRMWRPESRPSVDVDVRAMLAQHFGADVERLSQLTGRDLTRWESLRRPLDAG